MQKAVEPGLQPRVGVNEPLHQSVVPGHNDHQVVPVVLHGLQNGVDGLLSEVVLPLSVEGVGFVDEQHAAQGLFDDLAGLDGRLTHVAGHQAAAVHLHQLPLGQDAQGVVDAGHEPGDGSFAGAGISGEYHVQGEVRGGQAVFLPHLVDRHHIDQVPDLFFHRLQADIAVQLRLQVLDLLRRRGLRLLRGRVVVPGGGRRVAFLRRRLVSGDPGLWRLRRLSAVQWRGPPEICAHAVEVVLRHCADDLQLLEDDLVLLADVLALHVLTLSSNPYAPVPGTGRRRSVRSTPR